MTGLDLDHTRHWLERIYSDTPGRLSIVHMDATGKFHGTGGDVPDIDAALERIERLDQAGARGIYHRTTTLRRQLQAHERGAAGDSHALPGLWADVDFGTEGHKPGPGLALPPDEDTARAIVTASGLPAPSLWIHSGGGFYPWWLLDAPLILDDTTRPFAGDASKAWQQILKRSADHLGYEYGAGVGDLARVLRVPGTVNRKTHTPRPCHIVEDTGAAYSLDELLAAITANPAPTPATPEPRPAPRHDVLGLDRGDSAFDLLDQHVTFDDILTSAGWTRHAASHSPSIDTCWTRPGDPDSPCSAHTLTAQPAVLVVHSELAGLPTGGGQRLTRGRVFAHLNHRGDTRAAALDIYDAINNRPSTAAAAALPLPRSTMPARPYDLGSLGITDVTTTPEQQSTTDSEPEPPEAPDTTGSTWSSVDLADTIAGLMAGTITRPAPTIGTRTDGQALFYPGKVNGVAGASNAGKSWTGFHACAQQIADEHHVVYVDLEDDKEAAVARLLDLGTPASHILERFHYVSPDEAFGATATQHFATLLDAVTPSVVIIDSTGESLALDGAKPNDDDDVARWFRRLPTAIARRSGAAVVVLDHVTKAEDGGLWPIGSQRKRAAISGAQYMQVNVRPFDRTTAGFSKLVCAKDRHGNYHQGQTVALLKVTPGTDGVTLELGVPQETGTSGVGTWRPTGIMERISRLIEDEGEPLGVRAIDRGVKGKKEHKTLATECLVTAGHIATEAGPNRSILHKLVTPYRQANDPNSDMFQGPGDTHPPEVTPTSGVGVPVPKKGDGGHTPRVSPGDTEGTPGDTGPQRRIITGQVHTAQEAS